MTPNPIATALAASFAASTLLYCALSAAARSRDTAEQAEDDAAQMAQIRRRAPSPDRQG